MSPKTEPSIYGNSVYNECGISNQWEKTDYSTNHADKGLNIWYFVKY